MRQGEINLTVEVARVHRELTAFRDQLLPAFLGPCEAYLQDRAQDPSQLAARGADREVGAQPAALAVGRQPPTRCAAACQTRRSRPGAGLVRV